ncbi:MAG: PSD1 and planctomycete cytochrome C domain-containing protein [Pirellulales bacterium]
MQIVTHQSGIDQKWLQCAAVVGLLALAVQLPSSIAATPQAKATLPPAATSPVDFIKDIQPIFKDHCYACHGEKKQESGLRLDDADQALKGGDLGPAYVPGNSAKSPMVPYMSGTDEYIVMPPEDSKFARLNADEIGLIRAWIDQGAIRPKSSSAPTRDKGSPEEHWAFRLPVTPQLPHVQASDWPRNAVDTLVMAYLEQAKLTPADEADRATLIRRLSLDLIGLPPTLEEVRQFENDSAPDSYERLVERLLASPHYGERWALWWLDLARYADTNGYEIDRPRSIWLYRDWVVSAFNANMPFDQFTIEQLAGDLLPNATQAQRIATGFHRNTFINEEGGHNWEQFRWESIVDRVNTTSTVFLGLTMACAQCHDHKYDPISQKEYYEFFAFLNDDDEPLLEVPQPEITKERNKIQTEIARLETKLVESLSADDGQTTGPNSLSKKFEQWRDQAAADTRTWILVEPDNWTSENDVTLTKLSDQSLLATGNNPEHDTYEVTYRVPAGRFTGLRLEALPDDSLPQHGPGRGYLKEDGTFLLSEISASARETVSDEGKALEYRLKLVNPSASIHQELIAKAIDGDKLTGWHVRGGAGRRHCAVFQFAEPLSTFQGGELSVKLVQNFAHQQTIGRFRVWVSSDTEPLRATDLPLAVERLLLKPPAEWSAAESKEVKCYYLSVAPELRKQYKKINELRRRLPPQPTTLVLEQRKTPRITHQHIRGDFARPGPEVTANVPHFLPPLPADAPRNRLTLAHWLVNEQNPLTARVVMNQIWQCYFGRGLVNTPEDFGTQGAQPSNPELLDWLACRFMEEGWDLKQMHRLIVTSSTYRQASVADPTKQQVDPENILLSHGPRFRLPAETIRDITLTASGLLDPALGGPSIFTPQPAGALAGAFGNPKWPTASGRDRFRRALYTHRKRAAPYAAFAAFDAPPHSTCIMRRVRSNTPLQALAQLNDEMLVEASQALARRIVDEAPTDETTRLDHGFQLCLTRHPSHEEQRTLLSYFRQQRDRFRLDRAAGATIAGMNETDADKWSGVADLAAWTLVGRVLLNLDEAISKE